MKTLKKNWKATSLKATKCYEEVNSIEERYSNARNLFLMLENAPSKALSTLHASWVHPWVHLQNKNTASKKSPPITFSDNLWDLKNVRADGLTHEDAHTHQYYSRTSLTQ